MKIVTSARSNQPRRFFVPASIIARPPPRGVRDRDSAGYSSLAVDNGSSRESVRRIAPFSTRSSGPILEPLPPNPGCPKLSVPRTHFPYHGAVSCDQVETRPQCGPDGAFPTILKLQKLSTSSGSPVVNTQESVNQDLEHQKRLPPPGDVSAA